MKTAYGFKAIRHLVNEEGSHDFTRGKIYYRFQSFAYDGPILTENTTLVNDHGEPHMIGNWLKYFKTVEN
jgi:hypothetical protein